MEKTSPTQACKAQIKAAKKQISETMDFEEVLGIIAKHYPELDHLKNAPRIFNVWERNTADLEICEILKLISSGKLKIKKSKS